MSSSRSQRVNYTSHIARIKRAMAYTLKTISALFTPEILQKAVQESYYKKYKKNDIPEVAKTEIEPAAGKGDGMVGIIYRIKVTLASGEEVRLIGKGMPANLARRKTMQCDKWFKREVHFYNVVGSVFRKLGPSFFAVPDCYFAMSDGDNDFLLLEDLVDSGYGMADKKQGLNTIQTISIVKLMGRLHALSLSLKVLQPEEYLEITEDIKELLFYEDGRAYLSDYLCNLAKLIIRAVQSELQDTHYLEKYKNFTDPKNLFSRLCYCAEKDKLRVINHGDLWATNFMFDKTGALVKAIDFQLTRHASLVLDFSLVIFSCTTAEHRNNVGGMKGILRIYHEEIVKTMTALGVEEPHIAEITLERLQSLWRELGAFGLGYGIELVLLSMQDKEDVADMDEKVQGDESVSLENATNFSEVTAPEQVKRLVDMIKLAVDEGVI